MYKYQSNNLSFSHRSTHPGYVSAEFFSPGRDIYLFSLSTKSQNEEINYTISGLETAIGLTCTSPTEQRETTSRNIISMVLEEQKLSIQYKGRPTCCCGNWWAGFSVSGYMDPLVTFSVARSTSMTSLGLVNYDTEIVNIGQFNMNTSTFVAHLKGIYYFSISVGLFARNTSELMLRVNEKDVYVLFHKSNSHSGIKTISGTTLLDLQTGDLVSLHLTKGRIFSSPEQHELSFMCFLYSPKHGNSVAWMVSKTDNNTNVKPVMYDQVHIERGVQYHSFNRINVLVSGIYYIYYSFIVPTEARRHYMQANVKIAGTNVDNYMIYNSPIDTNDLVTVSGSFIYKLIANQSITIQINLRQTKETNDLFRSTSFMGFIITETND